MIRSSRTTLSFTNKGKLDNLARFRAEYQRVAKVIVNELWHLDRIPQLVPTRWLQKIDSWLSARAMQACGKQASGIVRGTQQKNKQRQWILEKLLEEGDTEAAERLQRAIDKNPTGLPNLDNIDPQLDARFCKFEQNKEGFFDGWLVLGSLGDKLKIPVPIRKSKHFNKLASKGDLLSSIRLDKYSVSFSFEIPEPRKRTEGSTLGLDIGVNTLLSCSDDQVSGKDNHGHDLNSIMQKLVRKSKGSKSFKKAQDHRKNYIGWAVNRLDLSKTKQINIEDIKDLRKNKKTSKTLQRWTYTDIFRKLESVALEQGVLVHKQDPRYTSQRCSGCGWVQRQNRSGKLFECTKCGFVLDADLNAARNLGASLRRLTPAECRKDFNKEGFYWNNSGSESIVPDALKQNDIKF